MKKHVFSGRAPVDPECKDKLGKAHVYEEGADVYDAMLNQTNIGTNNNKYYILQLLEDDDKKVYSVWFRWGRIGYRGQNTLIRSDSLDAAKETFCAK